MASSPDSFITPEGMFGILMALAVVCSFILSAPVIGQRPAIILSGGTAGGADYEGVATSAEAVATASREGPLQAVKQYNIGGLETPCSLVALDASRTAKLAGDDTVVIFEPVQGAAVKKKGAGSIAAPAQETQDKEATPPVAEPILKPGRKKNTAYPVPEVTIKPPCLPKRTQMDAAGKKAATPQPDIKTVPEA